LASNTASLGVEGVVVEHIAGDLITHKYVLEMVRSRLVITHKYVLEMVRSRLVI